MVEGPRVVRKEMEKHIDTVGLIRVDLRTGQKIVVWEDFASDSHKPMWLRKGDIGSVVEVDTDGSAMVNFPGKDSGGKSLSTFIKKSKFNMMRVELPGQKRVAKPNKEAPAAKKSRSEAAEDAARGYAKEDVAPLKSASAPQCVPAAPPAAAEEKPLTPEEEAREDKARAWRAKEPKKGVVRFTFKDPGPLGLRFSKDVPPWILSVTDGSPAARKAPRVPVAGIVIAVNGHAITAKDCQDVMQGLKKRPVVLDIDWPVDQDMPVVNRA